MYDTFDTTITIYTEVYGSIRKLKEWKGTVIDNCSWYGGSAANVDGSGLSLASHFKVRIKNKSIPEGLIVKIGSYVLLGKHPEDTGKKPDLTDNPDAFRALAVHKNTRGPKDMQHLMIEGG